MSHKRRPPVASSTPPNTPKLSSSYLLSTLASNPLSAPTPSPAPRSIPSPTPSLHPLSSLSHATELLHSPPTYQLSVLEALGGLRWCTLLAERALQRIQETPALAAYLLEGCGRNRLVPSMASFCAAACGPPPPLNDELLELGIMADLEADQVARAAEMFKRVSRRNDLGLVASVLAQSVADSVMAAPHLYDHACLLLQVKLAQVLFTAQNKPIWAGMWQATERNLKSCPPGAVPAFVAACAFAQLQDLWSELQVAACPLPSTILSKLTSLDSRRHPPATLPPSSSTPSGSHPTTKLSRLRSAPAPPSRSTLPSRCTPSLNPSSRKPLVMPQPPSTVAPASHHYPGYHTLTAPPVPHAPRFHLPPTSPHPVATNSLSDPLPHGRPAPRRPSSLSSVIEPLCGRLPHDPASDGTTAAGIGSGPSNPCVGATAGNSATAFTGLDSDIVGPWGDWRVQGVAPAAMASQMVVQQAGGQPELLDQVEAPLLPFPRAI